VRLDKENRFFLDYHILPNIDHLRRFHIRDTDTWLDRGQRLHELSAFCTVVAQHVRKMNQ
jgi:hypothetical protein